MLDWPEIHRRPRSFLGLDDNQNDSDSDSFADDDLPSIEDILGRKKKLEVINLTTDDDMSYTLSIFDEADKGRSYCYGENRHRSLLLLLTSVGRISKE